MTAGTRTAETAAVAAQVINLFEKKPSVARRRETENTMKFAPN
jgi:hypothetical protein